MKRSDFSRWQWKASAMLTSTGTSRDCWILWLVIIFNVISVELTHYYFTLKGPFIAMGDHDIRSSFWNDIYSSKHSLQMFVLTCLHRSWCRPPYPEKSSHRVTTKQRNDACHVENGLISIPVGNLWDIQVLFYLVDCFSMYADVSSYQKINLLWKYLVFAASWIVLRWYPSMSTCCANHWHSYRSHQRCEYMNYSFNKKLKRHCIAQSCAD